MLIDIERRADQPNNETKRRTMRGEDTGWDYRFNPMLLPSPAHMLWTPDDWILYLGDSWFRVGSDSQG